MPEGKKQAILNIDAKGFGYNTEVFNVPQGFNFSMGDTPARLQQLMMRARQKPESPRNTMRTSGHFARRRLANSFKMAALCLAPSMRLGRR